MKLEFLKRWVGSPKAGRRRKAVYQLAKRAIHGELPIEEAYGYAEKGAEDGDWSVRSVSLKALVELALHKRELIPKTFEKLLSVAKKEDENVNVLMTAIDGLARLIAEDENLINSDVLKIIDWALKHEKSNIREAGIRLLLAVAKRKKEVLQERLEKLIEIAESDEASNVVALALKALSENVEVIPKELASRLVNVISSKRGDLSVDVRKSAAELLAELLKAEAAPLDKTIIELTRKYLRDEKVAVKEAALKVADAIVRKNARLADEFLGIIGWEVLYKTKNDNLKQKVLDFLGEHVTRIPEEIVNKHEIPRLLDVIEKNTVPKNPKKAEIKAKAREILEQKLGYTFEKRLKKWGNIRFREK